MSAFPYNHLISSLKDAVISSVRQGETTARILSATYNDPFFDERRPTSTRGSKRPNTKCSVRFGKYGDKDSEYQNISGLCAYPTGDIVVADCNKNRISLLTSSGVSKSSFRCDCSIRDVTISKTGTLLVTVSQSEAAIMHEYALDGRLLARYGDKYKNENPFGIAVTSRNKIVISGIQQNRILLFNDRKKPIHWFGSGGDTLEQFLFPYYLAINSRDDVIVSDSGNHRIKVHKTDGKFKHSFGSQGSKDGALFYPMGLCVDQFDNIYVADANNYRVQMFSPKGKYIATPVKNTFEYGMDVKPINVTFTCDQLVISLRGTRYAEIQIFDWDPSIYSSNTKRPSLLRCCGSNKVADIGHYQAWS